MICKWKTSDEFPGSISLPFGIKTSHTWHEVGQILRMTNDMEIDSFLEIGVHVGGLASIVSCVGRYRTDFEYRGMEKEPFIVDERITGVTAGDALDLEQVVSVVKLMRGKRMFYCDGGNKVKEVKLISPLLRKGDVIACHDYYEGQYVNDLRHFGITDECGCKPEVFKNDLDYLFNDPSFEVVDGYLLKGTRIMGFTRL